MVGVAAGEAGGVDPAGALAVAVAVASGEVDGDAVGADAADASGATLGAGAAVTAAAVPGAAVTAPEETGLEEDEPHAATMIARSATEVARRGWRCMGLPVLSVQARVGRRRRRSPGG
jgi:hypothetical protein